MRHFAWINPNERFKGYDPSVNKAGPIPNSSLLLPRSLYSECSNCWLCHDRRLCDDDEPRPALRERRRPFCRDRAQGIHAPQSRPQGRLGMTFCVSVCLFVHDAIARVKFHQHLLPAAACRSRERPKWKFRNSRLFGEWFPCLAKKKKRWFNFLAGKNPKRPKRQRSPTKASSRGSKFVCVQGNGGGDARPL